MIEMNPDSEILCLKYTPDMDSTQPNTCMNSE
jgi:hypothetical protein